MKKFVFIILLLLYFDVHAQKQGQALIDSLLKVLPALKEDTVKVNALNSLSYEYRRSDVDEGIKYGTQAGELANKLHWKKGMASAYRFIAINYASITVLDTALVNYEKALQLFVELNDKDGIAKVYGNMGNAYNLLGQTPKALEFHLKALSMNEDLKDERTIAANLSNIGVIYFEIGKTQEAIDLMERAVKLNIKYNNKSFLAVNYHELSRFHEALKEYDKAFDYSSKAYDVSKQIGDKTGMALGLEGMGFIYESRKDYAKALSVYTNVLALHMELNDKLGITGSLGTIGLCYLAMTKENTAEKHKFLDSAVLYATKGIEVAKEIDNTEWLKINYNTLSEAQKGQGNFEKALASYKISIAYQDSLFNSDKRESIKNLEDKRSIELRDKQLKINELEIANRKKRQWLFVAGLTFLALVGGLLFWQNNNRKKLNSQLQLLNDDLAQANQTKTRFLGILNHDLRSPVANLISFLQLKKDAPDMDEKTAGRLEKQTMEGAENLLQSMEDLLIWSKGQMTNFKPIIKAVHVAHLFESLHKHFSSTQNVTFVFEDAQQIVVKTDDHYLLTIMRNLTGNAVKALEKTPSAKIVWRAENIHGKIQLSVTDNGPGIHSQKLKALYDDTEVVGIKTGLGLHLIKDLSKAIGCTIDVQSNDGEGTVFFLILP